MKSIQYRSICEKWFEHLDNAKPVLHWNGSFSLKCCSRREPLQSPSIPYSCWTQLSHYRVSTHQKPSYSMLLTMAGTLSHIDACAARSRGAKCTPWWDQKASLRLIHFLCLKKPTVVVLIWCVEEQGQSWSRIEIKVLPLTSRQKSVSTGHSQSQDHITLQPTEELTSKIFSLLLSLTPTLTSSSRPWQLTGWQSFPS